MISIHNLVPLSTQPIFQKLCSWRPWGQWHTIWREPLFPLFIAWYPVLYLYTHNLGELSSSVLTAPLSAVTVLSVTLLLAGRVLLKDWARSGLLVGFLLWTGLGYGAIAARLPQGQLWGFSLSINSWLWPLLIVLGVSGFWFLRRSTWSFGKLSPLLNGVTLVLLLLLVSQVVQSDWQRTHFTPSALAANPIPPITSTASTLGYQPDVYYIIFDRYAGQKTLQDDYGFDNSSFLNSLADKGFYVASQSAANYPYTPLSISSSLNMNYHDRVPEDTQPYPDLATDIFPLLQDTKTADVFHQLGYQVYQMGSWFPPTHSSSAADGNYYFKDTVANLDEFGNQLISGSIAAPLLNRFASDSTSFTSDSLHLHNFEYQEKTFPTVAALPGPKFVFVHMLMPHPPYVVDGNCSPLAGQSTPSQTELAQYLAQVQCANKQALSMVDDIMSQSTHKPIIILQSDEGPYPLVNKMQDGAEFAGASDQSIWERSRILNAYYLPDGPRNLYATISPVNSFRLVFRQYFNLDYPALADKTYVFPSRPKLLSFMDVTDIIARGWSK